MADQDKPKVHYIALSDPETAVALVNDALELMDVSVKAVHILKCLIAEGKTDEAIDWADKTLKACTSRRLQILKRFSFTPTEEDKERIKKKSIPDGTMVH